MRSSALSPTTHDRSGLGLTVIGALGCLLALVVGATAATGHAQMAAAALVGIAFFGIAIAVYAHDPIMALIWLWLVEIFNGPISATVGYHSSAGEAVRQSDEILVLLFLGLTIWHTLRTNTRMPSPRFILPGLGVAMFGLLGAALNGVPLAVTLVGTWLGLKLWIMIGITLFLPWAPGDLERIYTTFVRVGLFVAGVGLADYFTHAAVSRALGTSIYHFSSEDFRGESVHSIFPHPGQFSLFMSILFALTFTRFAVRRGKNDLLLALIFAGSVMLSLRLKGFLAIAAVIAIVVVFQGMANNRGAVVALVIGVLLLIGIYSVEGNVITKQTSTFTSSETTARARVYIAGEHIANADFPVGAGFGRFASYASRLYYSPVYKQYGLNYIWGLSRAYPDFLDDTSWPSVMGETGYGGLAFYIGGLIILAFAIVRRLRSTTGAAKWGPLATLCVMVAFLVDSLGDPTLFDWVAVTAFAMILGPTMIAETRPAVDSRDNDPFSPQRSSIL